MIALLTSFLVNNLDFLQSTFKQTSMKSFIICSTVLILTLFGPAAFSQSHQVVLDTISKKGRVISFRTDLPSKTIDLAPARALESIRYYENTYGQTVQAPTKYNKAPEGATALCRDGTYSFSQNRRGTCSHHGGVSKWL